jgi:hypothetical protein
MSKCNNGHYGESMSEFGALEEHRGAVVWAALGSCQFAVHLEVSIVCRHPRLDASCVHIVLYDTRAGIDCMYCGKSFTSR